ncbi:cannabinoid receptor 1-like [Ptychodera flava]|uniref:cannabinoid receptor 1-like n=1 Tax=Ptychodera flava TaxID=63121 RepID=UPI00396A4ECF
MRIQAHSAGEETLTNNSKTPSLQEIRTLKVLVVVFMLIIFGYVPAPLSSVIVRITGKKVMPELLFLLYPAIHIGGSVNPILYGLSNKNIRDAYRQLFTGKMTVGRLCRSVDDDSQVSAT